MNKTITVERCGVVNVGYDGFSVNSEDIVGEVKAAIPAADLEGVKDYTRLQELLKADREGRCFVLMVQPHPYQEKADVIICEDGEAYLWRVLEATIGQGGNGEINVVYETEGPGFQTADIGVTVFLPNETEKIEAALKKMQEEEQE